MCTLVIGVCAMSFTLFFCCCSCCCVYLIGGCKSWKTQLGTPFRWITCSNHRWRYRKSCTHETWTCRWGSEETFGAGKYRLEMPFLFQYIHFMFAFHFAVGGCVFHLIAHDWFMTDTKSTFCLCLFMQIMFKNATHFQILFIFSLLFLSKICSKPKVKMNLKKDS